MTDESADDIVDLFALSEDAVKRILDAVGIQHVPTGMDRKELAIALGMCGGRFREIGRDRMRAARLARDAYANTLIKHTAALIDALGPGGASHGALLWDFLPPDDDLRTPSHAPGVPSLEKLIGDLEHLRDAATAALVTPFEEGRADDKSAIKSLVVDLLPEIYREYIGREPGRSRPALGGTVDGPFVRFVQAVATEFGTTVSRETVDTYLKASRRQ